MNTLYQPELLPHHVTRVFVSSLAVRGMMYYKKALILQGQQEGASLAGNHLAEASDAAELFIARILFTIVLKCGHIQSKNLFL